MVVNNHVMHALGIIILLQGVRSILTKVMLLTLHWRKVNIAQSLLATLLVTAAKCATSLYRIASIKIRLLQTLFEDKQLQQTIFNKHRDELRSLDERINEIRVC